MEGRVRVQIKFSHRVTTTGDDPLAYVPWKEKIRDVPESEKKGWYWKRDVVQKQVGGSDVPAIVAAVETAALGMFRDPSVEAVAADGAIVIGRTTVRMQTHIERDKIEGK